MMRRRWSGPRAAVWAGVLLAAACGKSSPSPSQPPSVDPGTRITGRERLGWDQDLLSGTDISEYQFLVYVDGTRTPLGAATCDAAGGSETAFTCTAALPPLTDGRHTLEIAALRRVDDADVESVKSATLVVTKSAAGVTVSAATAPDAPAGGGGVAAGAFDVATMARGFAEPTDLAVAPDGRLFVAEREGRVRVIEGGATAPEPALELDDVESDTAAGLTGIALHPAFARNHFVYLAYTARAADTATYRVVRYRELNGLLGQPAAVLDAVPASGSAGARIRFAAAARLIVALGDLPGAAAQRDDLGSWNGKVLRLTDEGLTPDGVPAASPVVGRGVVGPEGMAVDPVTGDVWLAERRHDGGTDLGRARRRSAARAPALVRSALAGLSAPGGVAVSPLAATGAGTTELLVASGTSIARMRIRGGRPAQLMARVDVSRDPISCLIVGPDRAVYFCTDPSRAGGRADDASGTVARITLGN